MGFFNHGENKPNYYTYLFNLSLYASIALLYLDVDTLSKTPLHSILLVLDSKNPLDIFDSINLHCFT